MRATLALNGLKSISRSQFGPMSQELDFSRVWISAGTLQIIQTFLVKQIQKNLMTKFFGELKNPILAHFFHFGGNVFLKKKTPALSRTLYEFLTPCES